ncbi:hypothetical protein L3X38_013236 [Prunus dulcis]|uniref:Uncharacterized protein n=1 Tax=Prunus dulcis TaxID=3755 RepID=A0AAD4WL44_PRUDU|nr:hypothetical protein L3X38_013236 [Prunus dulcis]
MDEFRQHLDTVLEVGIDTENSEPTVGLVKINNAGDSLTTTRSSDTTPLPPSAVFEDCNSDHEADDFDPRLPEDWERTSMTLRPRQDTRPVPIDSPRRPDQDLPIFSVGNYGFQPRARLVRTEAFSPSRRLRRPNPVIESARVGHSLEATHGVGCSGVGALEFRPPVGPLIPRRRIAPGNPAD